MGSRIDEFYGERNLRRFLKRTTSALRTRALERLYDITARNWHILDTIPLHTINTRNLTRNVHYFGEAQIHDPRQAARFWPASPRALRHHFEPQVIPRPYMVELTDALVSNFTVVELSDPDCVPMEVFPEPMRSREHIHFMDKTKSQRKSLIRQHAGRPHDYKCGYLFGSIGWQNYYHTIIDHAARYAEFLQAGHIPEDAVIILPQQPNGFQTAILDMLGITPQQRVSADQGCIKLGRLLLPSVRRNGRAVSRAGLHAFRSRALDYVKPQDTSKRRIYLSRGAADTRRVLNEPEIEALLGNHGFTTIQAEKLSFTDQISLFSQAEIIAGPHGAGLTNAVFATAPHVIEFLPADLWDLGYFVGLTTSHGGTYDGIVCDGRNANDDMRVDLEALSAVLTR